MRRLGVPNPEDVSDSGCPTQSSQDSASKATSPEASSMSGDVKPPEPVTHVIASVISPESLDGLPDWCCVLLKEVLLYALVVMTIGHRSVLHSEPTRRIEICPLSMLLGTQTA
jgi:hypothetical protein